MSASSCCSSSALFSLALRRRRYGVAPSNSVSHPQLIQRFDLSFRAQRRPGAPKSLRVSCLGDNKAPLVTGKSWNKLILDSESPVLVEFYASWCGPCRMVHRVIDEIATEYKGILKCFVVDADNDSQIAEDYDIKAVPVVLLFKNGEKLESIIGTMPKEFYVAVIDRVLAS
ncbi:hypothetical protein ABFX02_02G035400 [Erythranthe guttata]